MTNFIEEVSKKGALTEGIGGWPNIDQHLFLVEGLFRTTKVMSFIGSLFESVHSSYGFGLLNRLTRNTVESFWSLIG